MKMTFPRGMNVSVVGFILAVTANLATAADSEDKLNKTFDVKPGGRLIVEADRGSIEVKSADADRVEIEVFRKVTREGEAKGQEILKNQFCNSAFSFLLPYR